MKNQSFATNASFLLIANALVIGTAIYAAILEASFADLYYFSVQEDEYMEWASFWAFLLASAAAISAALRYRETSGRLPWFLAGIALFCFLVAMEEISWGQRVFGYRPPVYFLEHNYQQEFNFHNVIDSDYRKLALLLIILAYGVVLPLLALLPPIRGLAERLGVFVPSVGLVPAFAVTAGIYHEYPWSHSGEWVELMLGTGMLFSLLPATRLMQASGRLPVGQATQGAGIWVLVVLLGLLSSAGSRAQRDAHPDTTNAARAELEALRRDFESGRVRSDCNLHKRLYTFMVQYEQPGLLSGEFSRLRLQGLPDERADFLIDPWNSPYWIRDRCIRSERRRVTMIYSFGPNRRRESTETEIGGDDIGVYVTPPSAY